MNRIMTMLSVLVLAGTVAAVAAERAPDFTLNTTDGKTVALSALKGKVVFIDFWASWCPPCRKSIPYVEKLHERYAGRDVVVLGINVEGDPKTADAFAKKQGIQYPVLIGDEDVARAYRVQGIPAFFIIGPQGTLEGKYVGFSPGTETEWTSKVDALLGTITKTKPVQPVKTKK